MIAARTPIERPPRIARTTSAAVRKVAKMPRMKKMHEQPQLALPHR